MDMSGILEKFIERAENAIPTNEGDYVENGLLHCGRCHTPKQTKVEFFGVVRTPKCLCQCEKEKKRAEEEERQRVQFDIRVQRLRRMAFDDSNMESRCFANDDMSNEKITNAMKNYVENFDAMRKSGKGLLLWGGCGTGKTFHACEVANALIDKGIPCLVTNFARLTNTIQGMYEGKQEFIDSLNDFYLLVIDDLGAERKSEFMQEMVFNIIDSRYRAGLPMIITTNLDIEEIKNPKEIGNARIYERIIERCFPIELNGKSKRIKEARDGYFEMKDLLGL